MEEFTLINKQRNRIKIFKPFEDISKQSPTIKAMEIQYACVYKRSSKPVIKGSRVESIEKLMEKYNFTHQNKQQIVLLSERKITSCSATNRGARKIEFKQSAVDQQQNKLEEK